MSWRLNIFKANSDLKCKRLSLISNWCHLNACAWWMLVVRCVWVAMVMMAWMVVLDGGDDDGVDGDGVVHGYMDGNDGVAGGALRVVHFATVRWMVVVMMWWMVWMGW
jgi:hypothetical protein